MKKTIIAIAIAFALAFSGCAAIKTPAMLSTEIAKSEPYTDLQIQDGGMVYKIPAVLGDIKAEVWSMQEYQVTQDIFSVEFVKADAALLFLIRFDGKTMELLALSTSTIIEDKQEFEYWIYNGKAYPKKVDDEKMQAYVKMVVDMSRDK